jgi:hypothetical protein
MVSGFLGTLVALERAVALDKRWPFVGPALTAVGGLGLIVGLPRPAGAILMALGSAGLVLVNVAIVRRERAFHTGAMAAGAVAWLGGNLLWLFGQPLYSVSYWWAGFLVLTIAGERLELSRVLRLSRGVRRLFVVVILVFAVGLLISVPAYAAGMRVASAGAVALALWLLRYDLARRNLRRSGLTRYIAFNLVVGYGWLAVSGVLGLALSPLIAGPDYDAWLHTLFLGFVFGMIFAHAPIILPALTGRQVPYSPWFYLAPLLLHASLLLRLVADLGGWPALRRWGGLINEIAILLFLGMMLAALFKTFKR